MRIMYELFLLLFCYIVKRDNYGFWQKYELFPIERRGKAHRRIRQMDADHLSLQELQEQLDFGLLEETPELQLFLLPKELYERTLPAEEQGPFLPPFRRTSFSEFSFFAFIYSYFTLALLASSYFFNLSISTLFFLVLFLIWLSSFSTSSPFLRAPTSFYVVSSPHIFLWRWVNSFFNSVWRYSWSVMLFFQSTSSKLAVQMLSFSCLVLSIAAQISILAFFFSTCSSRRANLAFSIQFSDLN